LYHYGEGRSRAISEKKKLHPCFKPIPVLIGELNRHLKGWANYFSMGYAISAYREIERQVQGRLMHHLQRRGQRPYRPPEGESWWRHPGRLGLIRPAELVHA
jgi:RNA-directed DNA polymerase